MTTVPFLFVGDSITAGKVGSPDGGGFRDSFFDRVMALHAVGPFKDPKGSRHGGVGGATTETFLSGRAPFVMGDSTWMQLYQPSMVHIMLGTNDLIDDVPEHILPKLDEIAGRARNLGKGLVKVLVSTIPEVGSDWFTARAQIYNESIRKAYGDGSKTGGIISIDSCRSINLVFAAEGLKAISVDGIHPNARGYQLIADDLTKAFSSSKGKPATIRDTISFTGGLASLSTPVKAVGIAALAYGAYRVLR